MKPEEQQQDLWNATHLQLSFGALDLHGLGHTKQMPPKHKS